MTDEDESALIFITAKTHEKIYGRGKNHDEQALNLFNNLNTAYAGKVIPSGIIAGYFRFDKATL